MSDFKDVSIPAGYPINRRFRRRVSGDTPNGINTVRTYRFSPDDVMIQIRCAKVYTSAALPIKDAIEFAKAILANAGVRHLEMRD